MHEASVAVREEACFLHTTVGWLRITADSCGVTGIRVLDAPPPPHFGAAPHASSLHPHLRDAYRQLGEYFRGERASFRLPLNPRGTAFQRQVWDHLAQIPFGETITDGELAIKVGKPSAAVAVGKAHHENPLPIVVPCHRVVGSDGRLIGFGSGFEVKAKLRDLEAAPFPLS